MGYNMTSCDCPTCGSPAEYEQTIEDAKNAAQINEGGDLRMWVVWLFEDED